MAARLAAAGRASDAPTWTTAAGRRRQHVRLHPGRPRRSPSRPSSSWRGSGRPRGRDACSSWPAAWPAATPTTCLPSCPRSTPSCPSPTRSGIAEVVAELTGATAPACAAGAARGRRSTARGGGPSAYLTVADGCHRALHVLHHPVHPGRLREPAGGRHRGRGPPARRGRRPRARARRAGRVVVRPRHARRRAPADLAGLVRRLAGGGPRDSSWLRLMYVQPDGVTRRAARGDGRVAGRLPLPRHPAAARLGARPSGDGSPRRRVERSSTSCRGCGRRCPTSGSGRRS